MSTDPAPVEVLPSICGCAGKTSIRKVVAPARRRMIERFSGTRVRLADPPDAALLPRTGELKRTVAEFALDDEPLQTRRRTTDEWVLAATLADATLGVSTTRFAAAVGDAYQELAGGSRLVVGKGHSVQIPGASSSRLWVEKLQPTGERLPGYRAANVDAIHAFPGMAPEQQAAVAIAHASNDCYASGGFTSRTVRPFVAVPDEADASPSRVRRWFQDGAPASTNVLEASVVSHDGEGWIFGATVTADVDRRPPVRLPALEPGDAVLLHRPLGGLALYSHLLDAASERTDLRERARAALAEDHAPVARAIASFCPGLGESFDPARHVKLVTDVSGDGILGLARLVGRGEMSLHATDLPTLDASALDRARERWVVPDVTVETNGPLAIVARPEVVRRVAERLSTVDGADPARLGVLRQGGSTALTAADGVGLDRYVERFARRGSA